MGEAILLAIAGVGGGLSGSIAGLASLVSYPALLAIGLAPTAANVTNTVALVGSTAGAVAGSRPELHGQLLGVRRLFVAGMLGGAAGGLALLLSPEGSFAKVVPFLIAAAAIAILAPRRVRLPVAPDHHGVPAFESLSPRALGAVTVVSVYGGYFGAGAGVMLLALLLHVSHASLPRANAAKSVILGGANLIAAAAFALFGDVYWSAVLPLGAGLVLGGRLGPIVVRHAPVAPLRAAIALAGLGLASKLGIDAYA